MVNKKRPRKRNHLYKSFYTIMYLLKFVLYCLVYNSFCPQQPFSHIRMSIWCYCMIDAIVLERIFSAFGFLYLKNHIFLILLYRICLFWILKLLLLHPLLCHWKDRKWGRTPSVFRCTQRCWLCIYLVSIHSIYLYSCPSNNSNSGQHTQRIKHKNQQHNIMK